MGTLEFDPKLMPTHQVPLTLVVPETPKGVFEIPVIVKSKDRTFEIKSALRYSALELEFWGKLRQGVNQLAEAYPRELAGALTVEEEMHLRLGSTLLPEVWGQDGHLLYDHEVSKDVLLFQAYKSLLKSMRENLDGLLAKAKERKAYWETWCRPRQQCIPKGAKLRGESW